MKDMEKIDPDEAVKVIQSLINKLQKCKLRLKDGSAQMTLLKKRIQAFELSVSLVKFYQNLIDEQNKITDTLNEMKADGKEKTVRYREMFGQKLINKTMLDIISQSVNN
jgi:hypothetical protein